MYGAKAVAPSHGPSQITSKLAKYAGAPMPKVDVMETNQSNAFAIGKNPENVTVAATTDFGPIKQK